MPDQSAQKPVTTADVARKAGVSTYVVSLALRGRAGVAASTRLKIEKVAEQLGYQINGVASLLAHRRHHKNSQKLLVGFIKIGRANSEHFLTECTRRNWDGRILLAKDFTSAESASRSLWQQGVDGIILATYGPHFIEPFWKDIQHFDWNLFPVVKLSRGLPELVLPTVLLNPFDFMLVTLEKVLDRGYRRIAVVLHNSKSVRDDRARLGALLTLKHEFPTVHIDFFNIGVATAESNITTSCIQWLKKMKPDCIITYHWSVVYSLLELGFAIPKQVALASVLADETEYLGTPHVSGCSVSDKSEKVLALDILEKKILHGERGFSKQPEEYFIEPEWIEGETLPRKSG